MAYKSLLEKLFHVFLYFSLAFLFVFLFKYRYIALEFHRFDFSSLILSFGLLFLGFFSNAYCWYTMCKQITEKITIAEGIISHGLSIFGKYIPGKVWIVLGRASYISRTGVSLKTATQLSLYTQVLSIWVGFTLGLIFVVGDYLETPHIWLIIFSWATFSFLIMFSFYVSSPIKRLFFSSLEGATHTSRLFTINRVIRILPAFFICWLLWTAAFFFFVDSVLPDGDYAWYTAFAFPLAATISILLIVFPGGLGIREGLLVFFLMRCGLSLDQATLVSLTSRIWFTLGEFFMFAAALVTKAIHNKSEIKQTQTIE
jgi:hypothetical protein